MNKVKFISILTLDLEDEVRVMGNLEKAFNVVLANVNPAKSPNCNFCWHDVTTPERVYPSINDAVITDYLSHSFPAFEACVASTIGHDPRQDRDSINVISRGILGYRMLMDAMHANTGYQHYHALRTMSVMEEKYKDYPSSSVWIFCLNNKPDTSFKTHMELRMWRAMFYISSKKQAHVITITSPEECDYIDIANSLLNDYK